MKRLQAVMTRSDDTRSSLLTCILHRDGDLPRVEGGVPHGWRKRHLVRPRCEQRDRDRSVFDRVHRAGVNVVVLVVRTIHWEHHLVRQAGEHSIAEREEEGWKEVGGREGIKQDE